MKYISVTIAFFVALTSFSQPLVRPNEMLVVQNSPISFSYQDAEELLAPRVIYNAFDVKLNVGGDNIKVYASILAQGNMKNSELGNALVLHLNYKTAASAIINATDVPLSATPVLLFTMPRNNGNEIQQHSFIYDVKLLPLKDFIKADFHNFTIIFTQTIQ